MKKYIEIEDNNFGRTIWLGAFVFCIPILWLTLLQGNILGLFVGLVAYTCFWNFLLEPGTITKRYEIKESMK